MNNREDSSEHEFTLENLLAISSEDCTEQTAPQNYLGHYVETTGSSLKGVASPSSTAGPATVIEGSSSEVGECSETVIEFLEDGDSLHIDDDFQDSSLPGPTSSCAINKNYGYGKKGREGDLHRSLKTLWLRLRKLGCIVDAAQVRPTRRKLKCYVDRCVYKGGPFDSIQLRCTLPPKVELAMQWICICVSDVTRQNDYIIKYINHLKKGASESLPQVQIASRKQLVSFPFRVCSRHFSTEPGDPSIPIVPVYHLPGKLPISRGEMQSKLRRRYIYLSETGYEDLEIDKLEPNGVLPLPSGGPLSCDVPGCRYKSSDISIFTGKYMKMFSVPANSVDHGKWRIAVRMGLGLLNSFDFALPEGAHICEMHFTEGKRYSRGVMKDPSIFRRLTIEGINPSLSRLGSLRLERCAVNSCANNEEDTICVPFPKSKDSLYSRWIIALSEADESFKYKEGLFVCFRHFSMCENDGIVPALYLGNEASIPKNYLFLKRRVPTSEENQPKKSRVAQGVNDSGSSSCLIDDSASSENSLAKKCCEENKNILAIVERMEMRSRAVERLVLHLDTMCRSGFVPTDGSIERKVKFQLFDILSELRSQRLVIHTLRNRMDEALRYEGDKFL